MLKDFTPRLYQETIFATVSQHNTLVVLPTGMGKTAIAMMLAVHRLKQYPNSKCLILAPTKPLVDQHAQTLQTHLPSLNIVVFTGNISPKKRAELWKEAQVIVSTPQGLENDVIANKIDLTNVSALVIDEAHRAVGDYSYVWVAQQYNKRSRFPRILALTASPGSDLEKIQEVISNLGVEQIEVRIDTDPDVAPYIQDVKINWEYVILPDELMTVQKYLKECFQSKLRDIQNTGVVGKEVPLGENKTDLLKLQGFLQSELAQGNRDFGVLRSLSLAAEAMKVQHALELLETQGLEPLNLYFEQIMKQSKTTKTKAVQNLVKDLNFRSAYIKTQGLIEKNVEHPKLGRLREILLDRFSKALEKGFNDYKIILFTQYRDSGVKLVDLVNQILLPNNEYLHAKLFVGQAKKKNSGLSQKEQIAMLQEFREGVFNVLVSSSVGEEGLDIPQVDAVFFYEPIPSAVRHIQRKGRTGRHEEGEVVILVAKGTRDEGYRWSAHHKEKRMYRHLENLRKKIQLVKPARKEAPLSSYGSNNNLKINVVVDHREKGSYTVKELIDLGVSVDLQQLDIGDYVLSKRCAVEFKNVADFVDSLIDGRLLQQAQQLRKQYGRPIFVIEGSEDIYSVRNVHPNAIRGMLSAITVDFGIPVLMTKTSKETAALLYQIAKREQETVGREFSLHGDRKPVSLKEQQEYIVSSFPLIGPSLVKPILKQFGSVKKFVNASEEDLKKINLLGDKKAKAIMDVLEGEWKEY
ncbi:DEAD/DEAH box helicase [Candidatus Woesearchaeota archaeon CG10_big_fil_rev_8_21_14_0_10_34_8]|nr:MAG: DEAD/DEAH box helicase [Candidatus Woesearchaeota archaeon CG10_big_fil_rev_8_21_14_0_10_34_8]